jgi:hypothetical protein
MMADWISRKGETPREWKNSMIREDSDFLRLRGR